MVGIKISKNIPSEISDALKDKFGKYYIAHKWEVDDIYYLSVYSNKCFYFCRFKLGQGYPYRSIKIELDNKVTLSEIKKGLK